MCTLDRGETFFVKIPDQIPNRIIQSNHPVALFDVESMTFIPSVDGPADKSFEQYYPMQSLGKQFFVPVTYMGRELIQVLAVENNTTISQSGGVLRTDITDANNNMATETLSFGINGSLRRRDVQAQTPYTEYYLFNSAANLKAYSYNALDFAYYGYNAANTRTYKLSMLNTNQWVNGQPQALNLQLQQAMFYPNAYLNFNHNGEYTKHYYNGTERIASRLGDNTVSVTDANSDDRLACRMGQMNEQTRAELRELIAAEDISIETPSLDVSALQITGNTTDIFYYHTNHLGSTAFVTDQSQNVTQGFLYAPFGEITTEFNATFGNDIIPKYSFNAKELDEETGMYYYEARYYKPPVFTSRDPMFEKYFWMTPYAYCANNPVKYVDPNGREINDDIVIKGKNNSSVTIKTDLIDITVNASSLGVDFGGNYTLQGDEVLSAALDLAGILDPTGVADGVNAVLQAKNGDWLNAGISVISIVPVIGDFSKAGKIPKDANIIKNAIHGIKNGKNSLNTVSFIQGSGKNAVKITTPIPKGYHKLHNSKKGDVYTNGKYFISPDKDGHNGGVWKMARKESDLWSRDKRMGTYDKELNRIGD